MVRLKGGDPAVFGRGGEEAEHLAREGVAFGVVPETTSAIAATEVAGIPVTHREYASSPRVVTGHEGPTKAQSAIDGGALADCVVAGGTLVVLMSVARLADNARALRDHGVPKTTSAAVVERATHEDEFTVTGTVDTIDERSREVGVDTDLAPRASAAMVDEVGFGFYLQSRGEPRRRRAVARPADPRVRSFVNTVETLANLADADAHLASFFHLSFARRLVDALRKSEQAIDRVVGFQG